MIHKFQKNPYDIRKCKPIGKGHNGEVYLLPDGRAIKISSRMNTFIQEYSILEKVGGNKYFPRIYEIGYDYMIRDYIEGEVLYAFIMVHGLSKELSFKILDMLMEFKKLNFTKIDVRCKDIYIQPGGDLKIIDPQSFYTKERSWPRHLVKGLFKLNVLDEFLLCLKEYNNFLYESWKTDIINYVKTI